MVAGADDRAQVIVLADPHRLKIGAIALHGKDCLAHVGRKSDETTLATVERQCKPVTIENAYFGNAMHS